jgi:hypothetical protein
MTLLSTLRASIDLATITSNSIDSAEAIPLITANQVLDNKSYNYDGTLAVNTGDKRLYMARAGTFGTFDMYVKTAPVGAALTVTVNKNGSSIGTGTIADGANSGTSQSLSPTSFSAGDYLTVNITQIGSSTAGEDLYINFRIAG